MSLAGTRPSPHRAELSRHWHPHCRNLVAPRGARVVAAGQAAREAAGAAAT